MGGLVGRVYYPSWQREQLLYRLYLCLPPPVILFLGRNSSNKTTIKVNVKYFHCCDTIFQGTGETNSKRGENELPCAELLRILLHSHSTRSVFGEASLDVGGEVVIQTPLRALPAQANATLEKRVHLRKTTRREKKATYITYTA